MALVSTFAARTVDRGSSCSLYDPTWRQSPRRREGFMPASLTPPTDRSFCHHQTGLARHAAFTQYVAVGRPRAALPVPLRRTISPWSGTGWRGRGFLAPTPSSRRLELSSDLLRHRFCFAQRGGERGLLRHVGHSSKLSLVLLRYEPEMEVGHRPKGRIRIDLNPNAEPPARRRSPGHRWENPLAVTRPATAKAPAPLLAAAHDVGGLFISFRAPHHVGRLLVALGTTHDPLALVVGIGVFTVRS